jgi:ribosomal protein L11 methyltransferase
VPYRIDIDSPDRDSVERLIALGALDIDELHGIVSAVMPDAVTPESVMRELDLPANPRVAPAQGRDSDSVWVIRPRPVEAGRLRIVPADFDAHGALRLLDRGVFGTGLHPTTALCLELVDQETSAVLPDRMLDVGTGSGVLALAALHWGVPRATALDTDAVAVETARDNARLNHMEARLDVVQGGPDAVGGAWPLVVANILAAPLIEMAPVLVQRIAHAGTLILSGIPESVAPDVARCYTRLGMRLIAKPVRAGWCALILRATW